MKVELRKHQSERLKHEHTNTERGEESNHSAEHRQQMATFGSSEAPVVMAELLAEYCMSK